MRLRSMGDCLLLTSPVRALKEEFPSFKVAVLAEKRFASCFSRNPDFSEVLTAGGKIGTAARLLTRRFDLIVNLHGGPTSLAYTCLAWGRRIGREHYRGAFTYHGLGFRHPILRCTPPHRRWRSSRWLGVRQETAPALRFEAHPSEAARIDKTLKRRPYAVVHPGSVMATKRWEAGTLCRRRQTTGIAEFDHRRHGRPRRGILRPRSRAAN